MSSPIVECIANYSEACRPQVIEQIKSGILSCRISLLDQHSTWTTTAPC